MFEDVDKAGNERGPVRLLRAYPVPGYQRDVLQPSLVVELRCPPLASITLAMLQSVDKCFARAAPGYGAAGIAAAVQGHPVIARLVHLTLEILRTGGMPAFSDAKVIRFASAESVMLALPAMSQEPKETWMVLHWAVRTFNLAASGASVQPAYDNLPTVLRTLEAQAPKGINSLRFLQAAHEAGIPWRQVLNNVFQFGWGSQARWLDSSLTDETPNISARFARNKQATALLLRNAGLPAPVHEIARDAAHALKLADKLGYPVVVKPANLDGGHGVTAGINDAKGVSAAYAKASKLSQQVLVEKHFEGNDYRLQVFKGEVFWVTHRVPASVTGDGRSTVRELLDATNADPSRGAVGGLKRIEYDDEAASMLADQGLDLVAVPPAGMFVRLRGAANVATGGVPVPALEHAHPDNLALAGRAARLLRLDIAGVDLLIPDIKRSWLESGALICEVNSQPQLYPHLPAELLKRLVRGQGRIPVVGVLGTDRGGAWLDGLQTRLAGHGICVGLATPRRVTIAGQPVAAGEPDVFRAGMMLLGDTQVETAIFVVSAKESVASGLPVDRFDVLVLEGPCADVAAGGWGEWRAVAVELAACSKSVVINQDCLEWGALGASLVNSRVTACPAAALEDTMYRMLTEVEP
ncbi:cyanophycin synthetase [Ramlibacter sp. WS9]|uniref:ATP-binding protein n=1 Tax=Ramlibacter sp. WS9 TaxID=1882741 RepID=UPI0011437B49|nr:cyanophycin synthetase [Ramlibacter sp. WS9]ROZ71525.1 cyanophycin synthetase [Ramlibacter sp. WS9]